MGALSSWAMLALTHHFIVQFAALKSGYRGWFPYYVVLGDDIVIFDDDVATEYRHIMSDLGVEIGLAKSLDSSEYFEFAKRFCHKTGTVPVVSFRELDVSVHSLDGMVQMLHRLRGFNWKLSTVLKLKGWGFRALGSFTGRWTSLSRSMMTLQVWMTFPGNSRYSFPDMMSWLGATSLGRSHPEGLNLQSVKDISEALIKESEPAGSTSELVPRDIFGPTNVIPVNDWRAEYLSDAVQSLLWPIQLKYMEAHRAHDQLRVEMITSLDFSSIQSANASLESFFRWEGENSLTPQHVSLTAFTVEKPKMLAGKWLRLWSRFLPVRVTGGSRAS